MTSIATVRGHVECGELGVTLMHEHVFILNPELCRDYPEVVRWDEDEQMAAAAARLRQAKASGVDTIVDLTVLGMGRHVPRVRELAEAADINIVVATGLYTFDELPYFLQYVGPGSLVDVVDPMVEMFVKDIRQGIADTGIKAAVLKCATDVKGVTPGVERVLRAVAQTHVETGTAISTHTDAGTRRGIEQLDILDQEGVDLTRVVIGHSGDSSDLNYLRAIADRGATLGMDRFGLYSHDADMETRVATVAAMCELGYASHMVLSHDSSCWMDWLPRELTDGTELEMPDWHLGHLHSEVLPALKVRGVSDDQIRQMLVENPARILGAADSPVEPDVLTAPST